MRNVWVVSDSIVSPLGSSSCENYANVLHGKTGIREVSGGTYGNHTFFGAVIDGLEASSAHSRFERIAIDAAHGALAGYAPDPEKTLFILATTKGNIEHLHTGPDHARLPLHTTAAHIASTLGLRHSLVVSNACISGVLALITAKRFLAAGRFDHAVVVGADVLSPFIIAGFQSLQALSHEPCRPFDKDRAGISLGEAAAAMLLTADPGALTADPAVSLVGEGVSNDANHISGPSRTGTELALAIARALTSAGLAAGQVDSISAHGTATIYNDEMEAKAFTHAGMQAIPLNSLKGYFGHTLGAAGLVETIITKHALINNEVIGTKGYDQPGVSMPINVNRHRLTGPQKRILKTASGFGGCNAAIILEKTER